MWPPEALVRVPPDWTPRTTPPEWQALVEVSVAQDDWQRIPPVREVHIWTGQHGLNHPAFTAADLEDLWEVIDWWSDQYSEGPAPPDESG